MPRLHDIREAVERAIAYGEGERSELAVSAALYQLSVIGEAVNALPADVLDSTDDVPKAAIVGMRNLAAHEYHRVSDRYVWGTIDVDLPRLLVAVEGELARLDC